jgi:hypothetical protein
LTIISFEMIVNPVSSDQRALIMVGVSGDAGITGGNYLTGPLAGIINNP